MGSDDRPNMVAGSAGIPDGARDTVIVLPFNENAFEMIEEHAHELAGVAIEPVLGGGMLTVEKAFLHGRHRVFVSDSFTGESADPAQGFSRRGRGRSGRAAIAFSFE
jgi:hypothetical protein